MRYLNRSCLLVGTAILTIPAPAMSQQPLEGPKPQPVQEGPGAAEQPAQPSPKASSDRGGGLEEIIVTARKRSENVQTVPVAVTALSSDDLVKAQIVSVTDLRTRAPGLTVFQSVYSNFGAWAGIRGNVTGDSQLVVSPTIGVYVDDVYQSGLTGLFSPNLEDVAQIEVLRGPQGTLYGRNTIGGAIKITHNLPDYDGVSGSFRIGIGNLKDREVSGILNLPLKTDLASLRVAAQYVDNNGFGKNRSTGEPLEDTDLKSIRATLRLDPTEKLQFLLSGARAVAKSGGLIVDLATVSPGVTAAALEAGLETANANPTAYAAQLAAYAARNPVPIAALGNAQLNQYLNLTQNDLYNPYLGTSPQSSEFKRTAASLVAKYDITDHVSLKSVSAYEKVASTSFSNTSATPFTIVNGQAQGQFARELTQELQITGDLLDSKLKFTGGYFYFNLNGTDIQNPFINVPLVISTANPQRRRTGVKDISNSVYGQATYALTDTLNITGGLRYTSEKQDVVSLSTGSLAAGGTFCIATGVPTAVAPCRNAFSNRFHNLSYLGTVDFKAADNLFLYATTSRGFKAGGQNGKGLTATATTPLLGFNAFKPEIATNYEIGAKIDLFDRHLRFNTAAFHVNYSDLQEAVLSAFNSQTILTIANAASAKVDGVEIELTVRPVNAFTLQTSGTYLNPRYTNYISATNRNLSGVNLQGIPNFQGSVSGTYEFETPIGGVATTLGAYHQTKANFSPQNATVNTGNSQEQRAYTTVDGSVALTMKNSMRLAVWAKNLFDRRYIIGSVDLTALGYTIRYPGPPRTYGLTLSGKF